MSVQLNRPTVRTCVECGRHDVWSEEADSWVIDIEDGERLAACVNQVSTTSTYRWDGEVHRDDEVILLAKTTDDVYEDLVARIEDVHPYDVPCIERFDEADVLEAFGEWREESVDR